MKILLGISGSIAAYKSAFLTRLLVKAGSEVRVIMTPAASEFITPLTLATLSKNPVITDISDESSWNNHVELGLWAGAMIIAPATANTLAKLANGLCDNMLAAVYLSARCPVFLAPAMDVDMWKHPATRRNIDRLLDVGNHIIPVGHGELASGLIGDGRMAEPETIVKAVNEYFDRKREMKGQKVLITAGPTVEPLDPVRFFSNYSTGKMGISLAEECARRGAEVSLILGPTPLAPENNPAIHVIRVKTAREMYEASVKEAPDSQVIILAAAVADYRPAREATEKLKKQENGMSIEMERTPDIAASLGKLKPPGQIIIGFALETENELVNARRKRESKNFDFIVLNSLKDKGAGFRHDTNKITIVSEGNNVKEFELKSKKEVAKDIVEEIVAKNQIRG